MLFLYNTLTRQKEEFKPLNPSEVKLYTCGPTVYDYPQIGNWRTFTFYDLLRRVLKYSGFKVKQVMNITDVGHLTGDNLGDADLGEDRLEKGAKAEGKTVWEVAEFYLGDFLKTRDQLNLEHPEIVVRATDLIGEQIKLIEVLVEKGLAYETQTGVFFDVSRFTNYGKLGGQKLIDKRTAVREEIEMDQTKRRPQDFSLWLKTVGRFRNHQMRWNSPWGDGFPGWHVECSAIALKFLGETLDIHTGGVDHIAIHHTNEIAQSEGATGKPFANFWLHGEFLTVNGGRMGKSLGNAYTLHDIIKNGFDPLALRYFYLNAHYRSKLNFTWEALEAAQKGLEHLRDEVRRLRVEDRNEDGESKTESGGRKAEGRFSTFNSQSSQFKKRFLNSINDDLNISEALSVVWELVKGTGQQWDSETIKQAYELILDFDRVLGLRLDQVKPESIEVPEKIKQLADKREQLRQDKRFAEADQLRLQIEGLGFIIEDKAGGSRIKKR